MAMKYGNRKAEVNGILFDSLLEAQRYQQLRFMEEAGLISGLTYHPTYELMPSFRARNGKHQRRVTYSADFAYIENGITVVEDVKGSRFMLTQAFTIKAKWFQYQFRDIDFRIVTKEEIR